MKINGDIINSKASSSPQSALVGKAGGKAEFKGVLKAARLDDFNLGMKELVNVVRERGTIFIKSPQEESLQSYKEAVKAFLNRIKKEYLSLKEEFGASKNGEQKLYQLVSTSEAEVKGLTQEAFSESKALKLLSSLDEIRGLVVDIIG